MKKFLLILLTILFAIPVFSGCIQSYPDSALYVGKNKEFSTIQSAIDAASLSGQFIVIDSGTYNEDLFISKPVKIVGTSNSVTISGSATISSDGVYFEKIVFSGEKTESENGIIIDNTKDITGLNLFRCSVTNYKGNGIFSQANSQNPKKFNALTLQSVTFVKNKKSGISINNIKTMILENCYFEKNGSQCEDLGGAVILDLIDGDYSSVEVKTSEFKMNGNNKNSRSASFVCSHKNSFDGEIVFDDCLFQNNSFDIISGFENIDNSSIDICIINPRGLKTSVKKLDENN